MNELQKKSIIWMIAIIVIIALACYGGTTGNVIGALVNDFIFNELEAEVVIGMYALGGIVVGIIGIVCLIILYYIIKFILGALN